MVGGGGVAGAVDAAGVVAAAVVVVVAAVVAVVAVAAAVIIAVVAAVFVGVATLSRYSSIFGVNWQNIHLYRFHYHLAHLSNRISWLYIYSKAVQFRYNVQFHGVGHELLYSSNFFTIKTF